MCAIRSLALLLGFTIASSLLPKFTQACSAEEAILPDGRTVILNNDGTWKHKTGAAPTRGTMQSMQGTSKETAYRDSIASIRFFYQPEQQVLRVLVANLSRTRILKPNTCKFDYNRFTDSGFHYPAIDEISDNFGNHFAVKDISPTMSPHMEGIYPGESKQFAISFIGHPIASARNFVVAVPANVFGNASAFEIGVPIKKNGAGAFVNVRKAFSVQPLAPPSSRPSPMPPAGAPSPIAMSQGKAFVGPKPRPAMSPMSKGPETLPALSATASLEKQNHLIQNQVNEGTAGGSSAVPTNEHTNPGALDLKDVGTSASGAILVKSIDSIGTEPHKLDIGQVQNVFEADLRRRIQKHWFPPAGQETKRIVIVFRILSGGDMRDLRVSVSSAVPEADWAAVKAIEAAAPFRPLPPGFPDAINVQFTFDANLFRQRYAMPASRFFSK